MNEEMFDEEMMEDMMLEGGRSTAPTYRTPFRRGGRYGQQQNKPQEFTQEKIHVWAFDSKAVPGGIYSYRLRIGFFNPIAGRNWFREDQKDLRFQRILWTDWTSPPSLVSIPRRTYFFPKSTMTTVADSSISVEIFRKQMGEWHKRTFRVAAGSEIGAIIKEKRQLSRPGAVLGRQSPLPSRNPLGRPTAQNTETVEVDYRTGATVVDVLHDQNHWVIKPNITQNINCTEIVYRDNDGDIKRIGSNKGTWPAELVNIYNKIQRDISKQKKPSPRDMRRRMSSFDDESM